MYPIMGSLMNYSNKVYKIILSSMIFSLNYKLVISYNLFSLLIYYYLYEKPKLEVILFELEVTKNDLVYQLENIDEYVKNRPVEKTGIATFDEPFIKYEPYGVTLIIGAWDYPIQLLFMPLVGAITAGNCAIIKPSEVPKNTENLIANLIPKYLNKVCINNKYF